MLLGTLLLCAVQGGVGARAGAASEPAAELAEARDRLVGSTREYVTTLRALLDLQEAQAERAEALARGRAELLARGIVSRRETEESERAVAAARVSVRETKERMAEADAVIAETLAAIELARIAKPEEQELVSTPAVLSYQGPVDLTAALVREVEAFFALRFGRPLPISARGQSPVHDRLGLDHRHAIDVAIRPDSEEGKALVEYLRRQRVPFLAFLGPVPGASTGAHLHIGPISPPLSPLRATLR